MLGGVRHRKGAAEKLPAYAAETGVDALGLDENVDPAWADANLPQGLPVQGNLDPLALQAGGVALREGVARIRHALEGRPHVFNLGHGIGQFTPVEHVEELLRLLLIELAQDGRVKLISAHDVKASRAELWETTKGVGGW